MELSYETVSNQGERVLIGDREGLIKEHEDRYHFALDYIDESSVVLDAACGSGYGTGILSAQALQVIGMDISSVAIAFCRENYKRDNVDFRQGSVEAIELPSDSLDVFVSFETLEHVPHPDKLIEEAWRVLKPTGLFLVSTPNRVFSGLASGEKPTNPFHLNEWSLYEFDRMLRRHFDDISHFGQRIRHHNKFHPMYVASKFKRVLGKVDILPLPLGMDRYRRLEDARYYQPMNLIAVCRK